jgi:hypothetical protein
MHETQRILAHEPAWLMAVGGRLWVTREHDLQDHVLAPGDRLYVRRGDDLVLSGFDTRATTAWQWQPLPAPAWRQALRRRVFGAALAAVARGLRDVADGFAALARRAAEIACRAQGSISAGDSIASAGAVQ